MDDYYPIDVSRIANVIFAAMEEVTNHTYPQIEQDDLVKTKRTS